MVVAENKVQENKLRLIGKLTASLMHEIRNPLSAIKLNIDYLTLIKDTLPDEALDSIELTKDAVTRIQYLVDNILTFTRKNAREQEFCSINEITKTSVDLLKSSARKRNIKLILELDEKMPFGYFDKNKVLQVFVNLITNSIESSEDGASVYIRTVDNLPDNIIWEVEDNGSGISDEIKEKIFQDFYTSKVNGTGLGLSVCEMILKQCQAEIDFTSTVGVGTKFIIKFNPNLMKDENEVQDTNSR